MKCYRVWFKDGTARLIDAPSLDKAIDEAVQQAKQENRIGYSVMVKAVECLDE